VSKMKELSEFQLSALSEVGNIGSGHAAIALSQLIGRKIMVAVTKVQVLDIEEFPKILGGEKTLIAGVCLRVLGDVQGMILLALVRDSAMGLIDVLTNQKIGTTKILDEMGQSALKETGTILSASYLNALCDLMKIYLIPSVPKMLYDRVETVLQTVFGSLRKESDVVIGIETEFVEASTRIKGYFLFMPEVKGLEILLKALGV